MTLTLPDYHFLGVSFISTALEDVEAIKNVTPDILAIGYEVACHFDMGFGPYGYDILFHNTSTYHPLPEIVE